MLESIIEKIYYYHSFTEKEEKNGSIFTAKSSNSIF